MTTTDDQRADFLWSPINIQFLLPTTWEERLEALCDEADISFASIIRLALADALGVKSVRSWNREFEKGMKRSKREPFTLHRIDWSSRTVKIRIPLEWETKLFSAAMKEHQGNATKYVRDVVADFIGEPRLKFRIGLIPEANTSGKGPAPAWRVRKWRASQ